MKKSISILLFCFLFSISFAQKKEDIIGTWVFDKMEYNGEYINKENPENSKKTLLKLLTDELPTFDTSTLDINYNMMLLVFKAMEFTIYKDGTYKSNNKIAGKYLYKSKILTFYDSTNTQSTNRKIILRNNSLIMNNSDDMNGKVYFKKEN